MTHRNRRQREKSETDNSYLTLLSHKIQKKMAAEAGNKMTNAQRHKCTTQMFLSFPESQLHYVLGNQSGQRDT